MKMCHDELGRIDLQLSPTVITIRIVDRPADAEALLPASVLDRLCFNDVPNRIRQCNVYLSHLVVALEGDSTVGFAAFKATPGSVRVAHEFWVDQGASAGLAGRDRGDPSRSRRCCFAVGLLTTVCCHCAHCGSYGATV